jgi:2-dehydropantoate 2-reductase
VKLVVLGAGAIGAYVGGMLALAGIEVTLVARGEHLRAMRERGLRVLSPRGDFEVGVEATDDWEAIAEADVVFVALKAPALPQAAPRLADLARHDATFVFAQNGIPWWYFQSHRGPYDGWTLESVDPGRAISDAIPTGAVVGCVVYCSTELVEPGVVRHIEGTRFSLGEPDRTESERCEAIANIFRAAGLKAPVDRNLRNEIWLKLLGNATFNPVSVLTGATLGEFGSVAEMRDLLLDAFREIAEVAERLGITFPVTLERRLEAGIAVGDHKTSMLQDYETGKPLEYNCTTGAVVELGKRFGVQTPSIATLHACVKLVDEKRQRMHRRSS